MFLLDTNAISHVARFPEGGVGRKLAEVEPKLIVTSIVVAAELLFGLQNAPSQKAARAADFLGVIAVLPMDMSVAATYARVRVEMKMQQMGPNDLFIAAHALSIGATLVTDDRAFSRVPGLKVENWLRA